MDKRLLQQTWRSTTRLTASRPRGGPLGAGNSGSLGSPVVSLSQLLISATVAGVSGVQRCFLPLPVHETFAPAPRVTSLRRSPQSSETRSPGLDCQNQQGVVPSTEASPTVRCVKQGVDLVGRQVGDGTSIGSLRR